MAALVILAGIGGLTVGGYVLASAELGREASNAQQLDNAARQRFHAQRLARYVHELVQSDDGHVAPETARAQVRLHADKIEELERALAEVVAANAQRGGAWGETASAYLGPHGLGARLRAYAAEGRAIAAAPGLQGGAREAARLMDEGNDALVEAADALTKLVARAHREDVENTKRVLAFALLLELAALAAVAVFVVRPVFGAVGNYIGEIEAQRAASEHLALAARHAGEAIMITDRGGFVRWVNPAFERLTGYAAVEIMGRKPGDVLQGPGTDAAAVEAVRAAIREGREISAELLNYRKDGTSYWLEMDIQPVRDPQGGLLVGFVSVERDITARRALEAELRRSNALMANVEKVAAIGGWSRGVGDGETWWTAETARIYGLPEGVDPRAIPHTEILARYGEEHRGRIEGLFRKALDDGQPFAFEAPMTGFDGVLRWIQIKAYVDCREGRPSRIHGTIQDVSERHAMERELRRSNVLLNEVGRIARLGGWSVDAAAQTLWWSEETFRIHALDPAAEQPDVGRAIGFYGPKARPVIAAAVERCFATGEPFDVELPLVRADGVEIWVQALGRGEVRDGRVVRIFGTFQDITQRRALERELRRTKAFLEEAGHVAGLGGWSMELDTQDVWWSDEVYRLLGLEPQSVPPTNELAMSFVDEGEPRLAFAAATARCAQTGEPFSLKVPGTRADGRRIWIQNHGRAEIQNGRVVRVYGTSQDVSDQHRAEQDLQEARRRAESALAAKARFIANMSHELRTPLTGIIGMSELLSQSDLDEKQADYAACVLDAGRALLGIVNDVLDMARIEAGKITLVKEPVSPRDLAGKVMRLLGARAREKGIELAVAAGETVPQFVEADPIRLMQVLTNLVGNAVKFTEKGSVSIALEWTPAAEAEGFLRIDVADTGIGFDPALKERLFAPFVQADDSPTRRFEGVGLGLAIAANLVRAMGGRIDAASTPGAGSRFWVELPALAVQRRTAAAELGVERAVPARILLAEDNRLNQKVIRRVLEAAGHRVTVVEDGRSAVEAVQTSAFDLALLDLHMPGMDGLAAAQAIRKLDLARRLPLVAVTADVLHGQRERLLNLGFDDFVPKPIDVPELLGIVHRLAGRDETRRSVA